jgi:hypothetical protein
MSDEADIPDLDDENLPDDPDVRLTGYAAPGDKDDEGVARTRRDRHDEEAARLMAEEQEELDETRRRRKENKPKDTPEEDDPAYKRTIFGSAYHKILRVSENSDGSLQAVGRKGKDGRRRLSDRQLEAIILRGALEKGWTTLHFYNGRHSIDQELTSRANAMIINKLSKPGMPLEGMAVSASPRRAPDIEPWNNRGRLAAFHRASHHVCDMKDQFTCAVRDTKDRAFNWAKMGATYRHTETRAPGQQPDPQEPPKGAGFSRPDPPGGTAMG